MNYLRAENLARAFGERELFKNVTLTVDKGERVALIAKNGSGKTSLLNILTGQDTPNEGSVTIDKNVNWAYLEQEPQFNNADSVAEAVFNADSILLKTVATYESIMEALEEKPDDESLQNQLTQAMEEMDNHSAWDIEAKVKNILTKLSLHHHLNKNVTELSGGQKKRLALARILIQNPDFIIMDEPTNHLDIQMIEWLEGYLKSQQVSLLLVTHDRYFLDNICTEIVELDNGQLYSYKGNYAYFLEKKAMRETFQEKEADAARKLMRKELEWMRKQPKARTTKSKSRISSFYETKEKASFRNDTSKVEIVMQMNRLGTKILETHQVEKKFGNQSIVKDFTYLFKPGERIGIIGKNGVGKSTFLNMLLGLEKQDGGRIIKGDTVRFGYYSQQGMQISDDKRVIEVITDIAEYLEVGKGQKLTATTLLKMFLFDAKKQYNFVSVLSGGEKRRLYLLTVLMKKPNFLVLDEPTNDLDIDTLNVLEEFLESYEGCLLVVTHDRYFMDTLVDSLFVFEGEGFVRPFNGNYQDYLNELEEKKQLASQSNSKPVNNTIIQQAASPTIALKTEAKKLSYKEQRELELLDKEMSTMQKRKAELENLLSLGTDSTEEIRLWGEELLGIIQSLEEKELRWLELSV